MSFSCWGVSFGGSGAGGGGGGGAIVGVKIIRLSVLGIHGPSEFSIAERCLKDWKQKMSFYLLNSLMCCYK